MNAPNRDMRDAVPCGQAGTGRPAVSSGTSSARSVVKLTRRISDPYHHRRQFPDQWAAWCRSNFATAAALAGAFQVDEKTARLWMRGDYGPQGWAVDFASAGGVENVEPFSTQPLARAQGGGA